MKLCTFILFFSVLLSQELIAQYLGGSGDGCANDLFKGTTNGAQVATQLAFTTTPTIVTPSETFSVVVEIRDAAGNLAGFSSLANGSVALAIDNNPASGTLSGTTPVNAVNGIATFGGMSINNPGSGYSLEATVSSLAATSAGFDVVCLYCGGPGDGCTRSTSNLSTIDGQSVVIWRGGASGEETDWATAANWVNGTAAGMGDRVYIEPNGNGHRPILAANTIITSLNFNSAQKSVELGNYDLSVSGEIYRPGEDEYMITNGSGVLSKEMADGSTVIFPVGNSAYNPVTITNNMAVSETFSVRVADQVWRNGFNADTVLNPKVRRTWYINNSSNTANIGSGVDFLFAWNAGEVVGALTQHTLFQHDGTQWGPALSGTSVYNNDSTLTHTGYKGSSSLFAIGTPLFPLPVTWLYFEAEAISLQPRVVQLDWATATEVNSSHFEVEWSADGFSWTTLGSVDAAGNSYATSTYQFVHDDAAVVNLYRLKQVDQNGQYDYSSIRTIVFPQADEPQVWVYPNPAIGRFTLQTDYLGKAMYQLFDVSGRIIQQDFLQGSQDISLEPGLYVIITLCGNAVIQRKVVVQ